MFFKALERDCHAHWWWSLLPLQVCEIALISHLPTGMMFCNLQGFLNFYFYIPRNLSHVIQLCVFWNSKHNDVSRRGEPDTSYGSALSQPQLPRNAQGTWEFSSQLSIQVTARMSGTPCQRKLLSQLILLRVNEIWQISLLLKLLFCL